MTNQLATGVLPGQYLYTGEAFEPNFPRPSIGPVLFGIGSVNAGIHDPYLKRSAKLQQALIIVSNLLFPKEFRTGISQFNWDLSITTSGLVIPSVSEITYPANYNNRLLPGQIPLPPRLPNHCYWFNGQATPGGQTETTDDLEISARNIRKFEPNILSTGPDSGPNIRFKLSPPRGCEIYREAVQRKRAQQIELHLEPMTGQVSLNTPLCYSCGLSLAYGGNCPMGADDPTIYNCEERGVS